MNIVSRKEAKEKGLTHYFTGKPCKHGHVAMRLTSSATCVECNVQSSNRFRKTHADEFKEYQRQWYHDNKDSAQRTRRLYRQNNPEKIKELQRIHNDKFKKANPNYYPDWWKTNKDKAAVYTSRAYSVKSRQKWNTANKGKKNYYTRKRQKQIVTATPPWADEREIKEIYIRAALLTETTNDEYHVDHIVPLHHELVCGLHVPCNLQIITKEENLKKGNQLLVE